jgi:hypothetical protein
LMRVILIPLMRVILPAQLNERIRKRDTKLGLRSGLEERWT